MKHDESFSNESSSAQIMSEKDHNAIIPSRWLCKIKQCDVAKVQKMKEHVRRKISMKRFAKNNCAAEKEKGRNRLEGYGKSFFENNIRTEPCMHKR